MQNKLYPNKPTRCLYCHKTAVDLHHVIQKSQGGSNNPENLAPLCRVCHNAIHHSRNTDLKQAVLKVCYNFIRPNLDKCWSGKIKPKIIILIEQGEL